MDPKSPVAEDLGGRLVTPFSKSKDSCRSDQLKLSVSSLSLSGRGKPRSSTSHSAFKFALPDEASQVEKRAAKSLKRDLNLI